MEFELNQILEVFYHKNGNVYLGFETDRSQLIEVKRANDRIIVLPKRVDATIFDKSNIVEVEEIYDDLDLYEIRLEDIAAGDILISRITPNQTQLLVIDYVYDCVELLNLKTKSTFVVDMDDQYLENFKVFSIDNYIFKDFNMQKSQESQEPKQLTAEEIATFKDLTKFTMEATKYLWKLAGPKSLEILAQLKPEHSITAVIGYKLQAESGELMNFKPEVRAEVNKLTELLAQLPEGLEFPESDEIIATSAENIEEIMNRAIKVTNIVTEIFGNDALAYVSKLDSKFIEETILEWEYRKSGNSHTVIPEIEQQIEKFERLIQEYNSTKA